MTPRTDLQILQKLDAIIVYLEEVVAQLSERQTEMGNGDATLMRKQIRDLKAIKDVATEHEPKASSHEAIIALKDLRLTIKQHAIAQLLIARTPVPEIARILGVSVSTIRTQMRAMKLKTGASSPREMAERLRQVFAAVTPAEYRRESGGLPEDWGFMSEADKADVVKRFQLGRSDNRT